MFLGVMSFAHAQHWPHFTEKKTELPRGRVPHTKSHCLTVNAQSPRTRSTAARHLSHRTLKRKPKAEVHPTRTGVALHTEHVGVSREQLREERAKRQSQCPEGQWDGAEAKADQRAFEGPGFLEPDWLPRPLPPEGRGGEGRAKWVRTGDRGAKMGIYQPAAQPPNCLRILWTTQA